MVACRCRAIFGDGHGIVVMNAKTKIPGASIKHGCPLIRGTERPWGTVGW